MYISNLKRPKVKNGRLYFYLQNKRCSLKLENIVKVCNKKHEQIDVRVKEKAFDLFLKYYDLDIKKIQYKDDNSKPINWSIIDIPGEWLCFDFFDRLKIGIGDTYEKINDGGFAYSIIEYQITAIHPELGIFGVKTGKGTCADYSAESLR
jgi:hypothetical protein